MSDDEKEAFLRRLDYSPGEFGRVMSDVMTNDATYVVKTTNTVRNSRSPESFRPVAVILPYERYEEMKQALAEPAADPTFEAALPEQGASGAQR